MDRDAKQPMPQEVTSYRGISASDTAGSSFDVRIIPEFDGTPGTSVAEWLEKVELVCQLRGVQDVAMVIPLRLAGGAFAVYLQLSEGERKSAASVKAALLAAFAADPFAAYERFVARRLGPQETPDVYLADLRRLAGLFGGVSERALLCAFVAGMPDNVRQLLRAGARMEELSIGQVLSRARAVLADERPEGVDTCCGVARAPAVGTPPALTSGWRCYACGGLNHLARDCLARPRNRSTGRHLPSQRARDSFQAPRQGNEVGVEAIAPASAPRSH